jgi:hypothetical protein
MRQADHYIIIALPPEHRSVTNLIDAVLSANGYERGSATVDYEVSSSIDEAYVTAKALGYERRTGRRCDWERSAIHNFSGTANGMLLAIFHSIS